MVTGDNANDLYAAACQAVLRRGRPVTPRGMATVEVLGAHLCLSDPRRRLVDVPPVRVVNPAFAVAEAVWILSGSDDPWIFTFNRSLARYADGGRLRGAYGPRMRRWRGGVDQLAHVRRALSRDPCSRQAVIQLFDPERDTVEKTSEYAKHFHPQVLGMTGSREQIDRVAAQYLVIHKKVPMPGSELEYAVDHSSRLYLVGKDGQLGEMLHHGSTLEDTVAYLREAVAK